MSLLQRCPPSISRPSRTWHIVPAHGSSLPADMAFARNSAATGRLGDGRVVDVAADLPRHDADGALLIEPARTNSFTQSRIFASGWSTDGATLTGSSGTAPDGTNAGVKLDETATTGQHMFNQNIGSTTNGAVWTISVFAKAGEISRFFLTGFGEGYAVFDVSGAGSIVQNGGAACTIEAVGNGWFRCAATFTKSNTTNWWFIGGWRGSNSYTGTAGEGLLFWGAQLEEAGSVSSYIPTAASAVLREADAATVTLGDWWSAAAGSVAVRARAGFGAGVLWQVDDGTEDERIRIERNGSDEIIATVTDGGVEQAALTLGTVADETDFRVALGWAEDHLVGALNGAAMSADTAITLPGASLLRLGGGSAGEAWNGSIRACSTRNGFEGQATLKRITAG